MAGVVFRRTSVRCTGTTSPGTGHVCARMVTASRRCHIRNVGPDPRAQLSRSRPSASPLHAEERRSGALLSCWRGIRQLSISAAGRQRTCGPLARRSKLLGAPNEPGTTHLHGRFRGRGRGVRRVYGGDRRRGYALRLDSVDGLARPLRAAHRITSDDGSASRAALVPVRTRPGA